MFGKEQSKINRDAAIANNENVYMSITPCKVCGSYEKYVSSYGCYPCMKEKGIVNLNNQKLMAPYRTNEKKRQYVKNNPKIRKNILLKCKYGITLEDYQRMYDKQNGCCVICKKKYDVLCVDHCHTTDKIRGLLCKKCNQGIGIFYENLEYLENAINYLKQYKANGKEGLIECV